MISLIIGCKGSGKTKHLVGLVNEATEKSAGNVVCVEKETQLTYDVNHRARLVSTSSFDVNGFDSFYGFLSGICAGDHDITDIFVDATFRIGGRDYEELADFLYKVSKLSEIMHVRFLFTISCDKDVLPARIFDYCERV